MAWHGMALGTLDVDEETYHHSRSDVVRAV